MVKISESVTDEGTVTSEINTWVRLANDAPDVALALRMCTDPRRSCSSSFGPSSSSRSATSCKQARTGRYHFFFLLMIFFFLSVDVRLLFKKEIFDKGNKDAPKKKKDRSRR